MFRVVKYYHNIGVKAFDLRLDRVSKTCRGSKHLCLLTGKSDDYTDDLVLNSGSGSAAYCVPYSLKTDLKAYDVVVALCRGAYLLHTQQLTTTRMAKIRINIRKMKILIMIINNSNENIIDNNNKL